MRPPQWILHKVKMMDKKKRESIIPGLEYAVNKKHQLTPKEIQLVLLLVKKGRMTTLNLHKQLKGKLTTIQNRINKLKLKGVIRMVDKNEYNTHILDVV